MPAGPLPRAQKKAPRVFFGVAMAELAKGGLWVNVLSLPIFFLFINSWKLEFPQGGQAVTSRASAKSAFLHSQQETERAPWLAPKRFKLGRAFILFQGSAPLSKGNPLTNANLTLGPRASQLISASESGLWVKRFDGKDLKLDMGLGHISPPETRASLPIFRCEYISCSVSWIYAYENV